MDMKLIESLKIKYRANKYKYRTDQGGISYLHAVIKKGQTVFDIGAHKAGYLYFMVKLAGDEGNVFAFEPQSNLYQYIKKSKLLFKWDHVTIEHLALSDAAGTTTLFIPTNKVSKGSSPGATIVGPNISGMGITEDVSTETLDAYCHRHNLKPDFLKIDVEGNELKIFQGGVEVLNQYKPKILVEIEARHIGQEQAKETFRFLESLNYRGHFILGKERLPLTKFSFDQYQNTQDMKRYANNFTFE